MRRKNSAPVLRRLDRLFDLFRVGFGLLGYRFCAADRKVWERCGTINISNDR